LEHVHCGRAALTEVARGFRQWGGNARRSHA
jgi:hypothetical protein